MESVYCVVRTGSLSKTGLVFALRMLVM